MTRPNRDARRLAEALALAHLARVWLDERASSRRARRALGATLGVLERALARLHRLAGSPALPPPAPDALGPTHGLSAVVAGAWARGARCALALARLAAQANEPRRAAVCRRLAARITRAARRMRVLAQPPARPTRQLELVA